MTDLFEEKEISPMLLGEEKESFDDPDYIYELKLDGIRCIAYLEKGKATLRNKRNKDVTDIYPELSEIWRTANKRCILDGELVAFTDGKLMVYEPGSVYTDTDLFDGFKGVMPGDVRTAHAAESGHAEHGADWAELSAEGERSPSLS